MAVSDGSRLNDRLAAVVATGGLSAPASSRSPAEVPTAPLASMV
jgi:hypothetical protein